MRKQWMKSQNTPSVANTNLKQTIWLHRTLKPNTPEESGFLILWKRHMKANTHAKIGSLEALKGNTLIECFIRSQGEKMVSQIHVLKSKPEFVF